MAWLSAVPARPVEHQRLDAAPARDDIQTRLAKLRADRNDPSWYPDLPEIEAGEHVLGYLFDAGPSMSAGFGPAPLSHAEIKSWQHNSGVQLVPWEAQLVRMLSMHYVAELQRAEKPDCPPPWAEELSNDDRDVISRGLQNGLRALMNKRKG